MWKTVKVMFKYAVPDKGFPQLDPKDMQEFSLLNNVEREGLTSVARDGDRASS